MAPRAWTGGAHTQRSSALPCISARRPAAPSRSRVCRAVAPNTSSANAAASSGGDDGAGASTSECGVVCLSELTGAAHQMELLLQANELVAREFYPKQERASPMTDAVAYHSYRIRHAAQNLGLHMREGAWSAHATLLAVAPPPPPTAAGAQGGASGDSSASGGPQASQQQRRAEGRRQPGGNFIQMPEWWPPGSSSSGSSSSSSSSGDTPVGVCNVTLRWAGDSIAAAAGCLPGAPFAMVTNMTVVPGWRRRGVAAQLLRSSLVTATCRLAERPHFMALLCYRGYAPAYRLYTAFGFVPTNWMDPLWKEDAEKSRVGKPRRLLMVKPLRPSVVPRQPPELARPAASEPAKAAAAAADCVERILV